MWNLANRYVGRKVWALGYHDGKFSKELIARFYYIGYVFVFIHREPENHCKMETVFAHILVDNVTD